MQLSCRKTGVLVTLRRPDEYTYVSEDQTLMTYQQKDGSVGYAEKTR